MSLHLSFQLNGKKTSCEDGHTVLQAAIEAGVNLPHLCSDGQGGGGCRMCTVRVDGRTVSACSVVARQRMNVESEDAALERNRRVLLALMVMEAGIQEVPEATRLGRLAQAYAVRGCGAVEVFSEPEDSREHPDLTLNPGLCVRCGSCVREIKSAQGEPVYYRSGRGADMKIVADKNVRVAHPERAASVCPSGAIRPTRGESPNL